MIREEMDINYYNMMNLPASMFQKCELRSNYYEVRINSAKPIHHYRLDLENSTPLRVQEAIKLNRKRMQAMFGQMITLDQNIYSPKLIQDAEKGIELDPLPGQDEKVDGVILKYEGKIQDRQQQGIIVAKLVKQMQRCVQKMVSVGNRGSKMFWPGQAIQFQQQNLTIWPGVEVIYKPGEHNQPKLLLIDVAFKVLRSRTAYQELCETNNAKSVIGQIVMTVYNNRFYKIDGIEPKLSPLSTFTNEKGEAITYQQYYHDRYKKNLDPKEPMLRTIVRSKKDKLEAPIFLPSSVCLMTGLTDELRNDFMAMKKIAEITKPSYDARDRLVTQFSRELSNTEKEYRNGEKKNLFKEWGVEISQNQVNLEGRRIHPGNMVMGNNYSIPLINNPNLERETQKKMFQYYPGQIPLVIIYNERTGSKTFSEFEHAYSQTCKEMEINTFLGPCIESMKNDNEDELEKACYRVQQFADKHKAKVGFMLFLLPGQKKKARLYRACKKISMTRFQCSSQVVIERTLAKNTRSIVAKIVLQMNAKVGGIPWAIDTLPPVFRQVPTMVVGTDCFKKPGRLNQYAFCSTVDSFFAKYYSQVHTSGEFNVGIQKAMVNSMEAFKVQNKVYPQYIIVYRDGTGEGQEKVILETEIPQFQQAIEQVGMKDKAKLVVVICNKRINQRFFADKSNPPPGTMVDSPLICSPSTPSFFLISQICRQGTVTPSLYKIAYSDIKDCEECVKVLTFRLCWLFYNFSGAIKTPAPVRYAHCLCNFIGENYSEQEQVKFIPHEELVKRNSLYYI